MLCKRKCLRSLAILLLQSYYFGVGGMDPLLVVNHDRFCTRPRLGPIPFDPLT